MSHPQPIDEQIEQARHANLICVLSGTVFLIFPYYFSFVLLSADDCVFLFRIFQAVRRLFFTWIRAVSICGIIRFVKKIAEYLAVMHHGIGYAIICYQLAVRVTFYDLYIRNAGSGGAAGNTSYCESGKGMQECVIIVWWGIFLLTIRFKHDII